MHILSEKLNETLIDFVTMSISSILQGNNNLIAIQTVTLDQDFK